MYFLIAIILMTAIIVKAFIENQKDIFVMAVTALVMFTYYIFVK